MSQTVPAAPDPAVAEKLAEYDRSRAPDALKEAADAAALHDGQVPPDPSAAHAIGRARLADWIAILSRPKRDLPAGFDPNAQPSISIVPPGKYGNQYSPGVNPKDVKDPQMRAAYIEAIQQNRERIQTFGRDIKLHEAQQIIRERAARSVADARATLGMTPSDIAPMLGHADIMPEDRAALLAAAN